MNFNRLLMIIFVISLCTGCTKKTNTVSEEDIVSEITEEEQTTTDTSEITEEKTTIASSEITILDDSSEALTTEEEKEDAFSLDKYLTEYLFKSPAVQEAIWAVYKFDGQGHYTTDMYTDDGNYIGNSVEGEYTCEDAYLIIDGQFKYKMIYSTGMLFMDGENWECRGILAPIIDDDEMNTKEYFEMLDEYIFDENNLLDGTDFRDSSY